MCPDGMTGDNCTSFCPRACSDQVCSRIDRDCQCLTGDKTRCCLSGYFGPSCGNKCPSNCQMGDCDPANGSCTACNQGYYGSSCDRKCPSNCHGGCESRDGRCTNCIQGYQGTKCDITGWYYKPDCSSSPRSHLCQHMELCN